MEVNDVLARVLKNARWSASRSSGPGGQHRDKASTRAELTIDHESLADLEPHVAERLDAWLGLSERPLRISSQHERSLTRNQDAVVERLTDIVGRALAPPPAPRRPTRASRAKRQARLTDKARRGDQKRLRRRPSDDD